jgi:hypothetical protein
MRLPCGHSGTSDAGTDAAAQRPFDDPAVGAQSAAVGGPTPCQEGERVQPYYTERGRLPMAIADTPQVSLKSVLDPFREDARSNRDLGDRFERMMQQFFRADPSTPASSPKCGCGTNGRSRCRIARFAGVPRFQHRIAGWAGLSGSVPGKHWATCSPHRRDVAAPVVGHWARRPMRGHCSENLGRWTQPPANAEVLRKFPSSGVAVNYAPPQPLVRRGLAAGEGRFHV